MKEMEIAVTAAFTTMAASGALQKVIEENVTKAVSECVKNTLGSYSDFSKALNEHVKTALNVDFRELGLTRYNEIVLKIIKAKLADSINTVGVQRLEKEMGELLVNPPAEIKLSALVEQFKRNLDRYDRRDGRITCDVNTADSTGICPGYAHIYMDKESGKSRYSCEIQIDVTPAGKVFGLKIGGTDIKNTLFVGPHFGFERSLFQLYAAGTKIIVDGDDIDDYCGGED
jgi:hypothetical protein